MSGEIGLPEALERAAGELPRLADRIRPANGDPAQLARELDGEAARELLAWLLAEQTAAGEELCLAWAEDPETCAWLLELDPAPLPKRARKVLARLTHRLRSRGVEVRRPAPAPRAAALAPVDERIDTARLSAPDPYGARAVYLASDRPGGGVRLFELVIDDEQGVHAFELYETGRSRARSFLRELARRERWPAVETPPDAVRALIARAVAHQPADRALPKGFGHWQARLSEHSEDTALPGALAREAVAPAAEPDRERLHAWLEAGELGPWPPPFERLRDLVSRLEEISSGRVILSGHAREEQIDAALEEALDAVYDAERYALLAERLDEVAYVWWRSGREDAAAQARAAAEAFRGGSPAARQLSRRMLERALRPAIERARSGADEEPGSPEPAEADPASTVVTG